VRAITARSNTRSLCGCGRWSSRGRGLRSRRCCQGCGGCNRLVTANIASEWFFAENASADKNTASAEAARLVEIVATVGDLLGVREREDAAFHRGARRAEAARARAERAEVIFETLVCPRCLSGVAAVGHRAGIVVVVAAHDGARLGACVRLEVARRLHAEVVVGDALLVARAAVRLGQHRARAAAVGKLVVECARLVETRTADVRALAIVRAASLVAHVLNLARERVADIVGARIAVIDIGGQVTAMT